MEKEVQLAREQGNAASKLRRLCPLFTLSLFPPRWLLKSQLKRSTDSLTNRRFTETLTIVNRRDILGVGASREDPFQ